MSTIQSSMTEAQVHATSFKGGSQSLTSITQAVQDDLTTVSGNSKAHEALTTAQTTRQGISQCLSDMVNNLNSVAGDFEALDQEIAHQTTGGPV